MKKLIFNDDNCKGCGLCVDVCPKGILQLSKDRINLKGHHPAEVTDEDACISCASCAIMCPDCVITVMNDKPEKEKEPAAEEKTTEENVEKQEFEVPEGKRDVVLMKGNEALSEAAILAGCRHYFGYPITPQTEIAAYMAKRMPKIGGTFLQAESEIAAINMVYGVSSAGKRVMTSSSSPGISLKGEGISYLAGCDLPALIVNVQRGGPGLGGIQPSQSDYFQATRGGGHGDYHLIVLAPASVQEMADLTVKAFELADKYRMPAMILADGTIGQMMEPVSLDLKIEPQPEKPWTATGTKMKREHNIINSLALVPEVLEDWNETRYRKYAVVEEEVPEAEEYMTDDAEIILAAFGITARVAKNAVNAAREQGIKAGLIRPITLWPFPKASFEKTSEHAKRYISVELNMGQMIEDIRLSVHDNVAVSLCSRTGGIIISPEEVLEAVKNAYEEIRSGKEEKKSDSTGKTPCPDRHAFSLLSGMYTWNNTQTCGRGHR